MNYSHQYVDASIQFRDDARKCKPPWRGTKGSCTRGKEKGSKRSIANIARGGLVDEGRKKRQARIAQLKARQAMKTASSGALTTKMPAKPSPAGGLALSNQSTLTPKQSLAVRRTARTAARGTRAASAALARVSKALPPKSKLKENAMRDAKILGEVAGRTVALGRAARDLSRNSKLTDRILNRKKSRRAKPKGFG